MEIVNSLLLLQPGIYILRHPKNNPAPLSIARAAADPRATGTLQVMGTPGTDNTVLRHGADCLVVQITEAAVELLITAYLPHAGAAVPALRVDQVGLDPAPGPVMAAPAAPSAVTPSSGPIAIPPAGLSLIGHIERTGDLVASSGTTLGNPERQFRLEGFQVMWPDKPDGVDLAYSVAIEGGAALPVVKSGKFCGTRGQARRITELTLALIGPRAHAYSLQGTAWFSGGFQAPVQSGLPLGGPSGLEHLTALRLAVVPALETTANPWDASPRTKVFRQGAIQPDPLPVTSRRSTAPAARTAKAATAAPAPLKTARPVKATPAKATAAKVRAPEATTSPRATATSVTRASKK